MFNYQKICQQLLRDLPKKQKEVILRRFALTSYQNLVGQIKRESLESIGKSFGITRERVRQIEEDALRKIKPKIAQYPKVFQYFRKTLKRWGGLKKEEALLAELGGKRYQPQVYFLLAISEEFERFGQGRNEDFYPFWATDRNSLNLAKKIINILLAKLKEIGKPLSLEELSSFISSEKLRPFLISYVEVSKKIFSNSEKLYGLKDWPEINPRGVKDKAYLTFKKLGKPLHFSEVANSIEGALSQTVHNELIKDPRFVLVGRGIYALKEWGYLPGQVKDVISQILKKEGPLTQREILERVLKQRLVKENTILLNLNNRKYFLRDSEGKYRVKEI